jgi:hypothetical protein
MKQDEDEKTKEPASTPKRADDRPRDPVEEADEESFPASDPPGWIPMHPGAPKQQDSEPSR